MSDNMNRAANEFDDAVQGVGNEMNQAARDVADSLREAADKAANLAAEAAHEAADSAEQTAHDAGKAAKSSVDDIADSVERASTQVADTARQAWESEQRKEVQESVVKGLSELANAIEDQARKIAAKPDTQKVVARIEEVTERAVAQVRTSKTLQDLAEGLARGLSAMATSIEGWLSSQKDKAGEGEDLTSIEVARLEPPVAATPPPVSLDDTQADDADDTQSIEIDRPE
jgi:vacuolar-type H+-ATPase subunit E/Vma4